MMYGQPSYSEGRPEYSMKPRTKELDSCGQCTRYLLIAINIVFFMCCCTVVGVTTWILIEKNYMSAIYGNVLMTVSGYLIVIGAAIGFFTTMVGCFGAIARNKIMLLIYFCALCLVAILLIVGAILSIVYRTQINYKVLDNMSVSLQKDYGHSLDNPYNARLTRDWDKAQTELYCCSVEENDWLEYQSSEWYDNQPGIPGISKPYVPISCCVRDQYGDYLDSQMCQTWELGPPHLASGEDNPALYYRGCFAAGRTFIREYTGYLIGMSIGVAVPMLAGAGLTGFYLMKNWNNFG